MLDTPHNEFHMISMMVTQARFLALFASIIELDQNFASQEAHSNPPSVASTAVAIREDLPSAETVVATREGLLAPWEEVPEIPAQVPTGNFLMQFLSLKAGQMRMPEIGDRYRVRPRSHCIKLPPCYECNLGVPHQMEVMFQSMNFSRT